MSPVNGSFYASPKVNPSICPGEYFPKRYSPGTGTKWFTNQINLCNLRSMHSGSGGQIINTEVCEKMSRDSRDSKVRKMGIVDLKNT